MVNYQADLILNIARQSITHKVIDNIEWEPELTTSWLRQQSGAFTTLYQQIKKNTQLRGCIGVPQPEYPLGKAIAISARRAATKDYRFPPVTPQELQTLTLSVEVLSPLEPLDYTILDELYDQIELGKTGLVVRYQNTSALFLPRVPVEQQWNKQQYVNALCSKAMISTSLLGKEPLEFLVFTTHYFAERR